MGTPSLSQRALLCFCLSLFFAAGLCHVSSGDKAALEVVDNGECKDCAQSNFKDSLFYFKHKPFAFKKPFFKKPLPKIPIYKKPLPPVPVYKKPPIPIYKKPHPPLTVYKKPIPPIPEYKKPLPIYKPKPLPPLPKIPKKPCPPKPELPPKYFFHPKFGPFPHHHP